MSSISMISLGSTHLHLKCTYSWTTSNITVQVEWYLKIEGLFDTTDFRDTLNITQTYKLFTILWKNISLEICYVWQLLHIAALFDRQWIRNSTAYFIFIRLGILVDHLSQVLIDHGKNLQPIPEAWKDWSKGVGRIMVGQVLCFKSHCYV